MKAWCFQSADLAYVLAVSQKLAVWLFSLIIYEKTEVHVCASDRFLLKVVEPLGRLVSYVRPSLRNLCVTLDFATTLDAHVKWLVCSCFYHLKNITKLSPIVSHTEMKMIPHTFISSHIDFCNSFSCLSKRKILLKFSCFLYLFVKSFPISKEATNHELKVGWK